jgi:hypothetical protein
MLVLLLSIFLKLIIIICVQVGQTALLTALDDCNELIAQVLVENGADLDVQDEVCLSMADSRFSIVYIDQANNHAMHRMGGQHSCML